MQKLIVKTDPVFVKNMISHVKLKKVEISKPAIYTNVEFKLNKKEFNYP